jgi:nucleoside-diphosphate-sugar epimerase
MRTISFRLFSLYAGIQGGDDFLSKWLDSARHLGKIDIWGGDQIRSFIHYTDAVSAMMLVIANSPDFSRVDIGTNDRYTLTNLANLISAKATLPITLNYEQYNETQFRNQISNQEILDSYNWKPQFNIFDTVLRYFSN